MNRPLIRAGGAETIPGQIGALADAHAGVTNQQKGIAAEIVAAEELLLRGVDPVLAVSGRGSVLRETRNVLAADQMGEFRKLFGPSQFIEDAAQMR